MAHLLPNVKQKFFDANGLPLAGGKLYSYAAGTTTPLATYTDQGAGTPNTNPIILDANGEANIWMSSAAYKFKLTDSADVQLWVVDNVQWIDDGEVGTTQLANLSVTTAKLADSAVTTAKILDANVTTAKLADGAVTATKIPDGTLEPAKMASDFDFSAMTQSIECVVKNSGDFAKGRVSVIPQLPWSSPNAPVSPATLPAGNAWMSAWTPCGEYLAVAHENSPRISVYQRMGTTFKKLSDPTSTPGSNVTGIAWSPCGTLLAVAMASSPYFGLYKRTSNTLTLTAEGFTLSAAANCVSFSPNGQFLAVGTSDATRYLRIAQLTDYSPGAATILTIPFTGLSTAGGNTYTDVAVNSAVDNQVTSERLNFTALGKGMLYQGAAAVMDEITPTISAQPAGSVTGVSWSPTGEFVAVAHTTTPFVTVYQRSGTTFTKLSAPASLPPGNAAGCAFSPSGEFLAVTSGTSPYITNYQRSGTTFTKLSSPATLPTGTCGTPGWSPNGRYLAVAHATSPYVTIYDRSGTTFTKLANPSTLLTAQGSSAQFSPNQEFLAVTQFGSPYLSVYQSSASYPTNAVLYVKEVPRV